MRIYRDDNSNTVFFEGIEIAPIPCNTHEAVVVDGKIRIQDKTSPTLSRIVNKISFDQVETKEGQTFGTIAETLEYLEDQLSTNLPTSVYSSGRLEGLYLSTNGETLTVSAGKALVVDQGELIEVKIDQDFTFNKSQVLRNSKDHVYQITLDQTGIQVTKIENALQGDAAPTNIREVAFLGLLFYNDGLDLFTYVQSLANTAKNVGSSVYDLAQVITPKVLPTHKPEIKVSNADPYRIGITACKIFSYGANLIQQNDTNPNIFDFAENLDISEISVYEPNGQEWKVNFSTNFETENGTKLWKLYNQTTTPNKDWVIMPVTLNAGMSNGTPTALPAVYMAQSVVSNKRFNAAPLIEVVNALQTYNFPALAKQTSAIIGAIAMRGRANDLNEAIFFSGDVSNLVPSAILQSASILDSIPIYDIYVKELPTNGLGSATQPFNNLQDAIDEVPDGGSIFIDGTILITSELTWTNKSIKFFGSSKAVIKYENFDVNNGNIFSFEGDNSQNLEFNDLIFQNAGQGYALLIKKVDSCAIRNCTFTNNGWNGQGLNTILPSNGLLGYDSEQTDLQNFYASSNAANGGAVRMEECRLPLIRESRAEANLRGFRLQDCGINGGGFVIENRSVGNIESGIYLAAGSSLGCQNITVAVNYSAYNANNGLLCIGGINNKFSQNEVNGNWNAGFCAWGSANTTLRDCGLYDNNRSQFNGIGNTGDAKASIQINEAYTLLETTISLNPNARFIAEILDTQVHYTGLGSNSDKVGFLITEEVGLLPDSDKNIIKIDDVGFIGQDYAIDFSEVDLTNLRVALGDNSYMNIGEKAVKDSTGNYFELPYSNHVTNVNYLDLSINQTGGVIAKEGVNGKIINPYQVNQLQAIAFNSKIRIVLKDSNKIQFEVPVNGCSINGLLVNSVLSQALVQLNDLFTNTQGFTNAGNPVTDFTLIGNDLTITLQDNTSYTVDVTTLGVDENKFVVSGQLNGSSLDLTMNDSTIVSIDASNMVNGSQLPAISNNWFIAYGASAGQQITSPSIVADIADKQPFYNGDFLNKGEEYIWTHDVSGFYYLGIYSGLEQPYDESEIIFNAKWSNNFKFLNTKVSENSVAVDVSTRYSSGYDISNNTFLALAYDSDNYLKLYDISNGRVLIGQSNNPIVGDSVTIFMGGENQPNAKLPVMIKRFSQWSIVHDFDNSETSIIDGLEQYTVIKSNISLSPTEKFMINFDFEGNVQRFGLGYLGASSGVTNANLQIENSLAYGTSEQFVQSASDWTWNTNATGYNPGGPKWSRGSNAGMLSLRYLEDNSIELWSEDLNERIATKTVQGDGNEIYFYFGVSGASNDIPTISKQLLNQGSQPSSFAPDISDQAFDITENEAFNLQIIVDENIVNQFAAVDAPSWAILNQITGIFSGTAPAYNGSNYAINCKAGNAVGGITNFTITLNVIEKVYTNTKSLRFQDGVSSYLGGNAALVTALERSSNGTGAADAWTVAFWFKGSSFNTGQTLFYFGASDVTNNGHIEIKQTNHNGQKRLRFRYGSNVNHIQLTTPSGSINPSQWQHVLVSYNGGQTGVASGSLSNYYSRFKIFIDGVQQTTSNTHNNNGYNGSIIGQNYRFGRFSSGNYPKDILLNQLAIWNSDQSSNIAGLYNSGDTQDISALAPGVGTMNTNYLPPDHYYEIETSVSLVEDLIGTAHFVGYNFNSSDLVNDTP